jgi:phage terminase small subunit
MSGVKGRSGGPRPNSGGKRPGAGRKPKPKQPPAVIDADTDMLKLLQDVALGRVDATALQVRAAGIAVRYTHTAAHDGGKKNARQDAADAAGEGKFAPKAQPLKLVKLAS